jgi:hypothetical protein
LKSAPNDERDGARRDLTTEGTKVTKGIRSIGRKERKGRKVRKVFTTETQSSQKFGKVFYEKLPTLTEPPCLRGEISGITDEDV